MFLKEFLWRKNIDKVIMIRLAWYLILLKSELSRRADMEAREIAISLRLEKSDYTFFQTILGKVIFITVMKQRSYTVTEIREIFTFISKQRLKPGMTGLNFVRSESMPARLALKLLVTKFIFAVAIEEMRIVTL